MSSEIAVPALLTLEGGLVGLPETRSLEVESISGGVVVELTDPAMPGLGWLAVDAEDVRLGMTATLRAGGHIAADEVLLVLLSNPQPDVVTANLAGPIAVAPDGTARQLVLEDPEYSVRARISPPTSSAGEGR